MSHRLPLADGEVARVAGARILVRGGTDERTGEVLSAAVVAERVGWCTDVVQCMTAGLLADHWNRADIDTLAAGADVTGRPLPSQAWMALRRLGWGAKVPDGIKVNDRIARMAQEQAGRVLRSASWRAVLIAAVLATWPGRPLRRTSEEWDAVRVLVPGGEHLPCSVLKARTRQVMRFLAAEGRLPRDLIELEAAPGAARILLLSACDRQQAAMERSSADPRQVLLRIRLPIRPDPQSYQDWAWVSCVITLPPTVPVEAVLHLPVLRVHGGQVRADFAFTYAVPAARRNGHAVALGVDWGLNTLLSAGAAQLQQDGTITTLGAGAQYRAAGVLAKQHRLRLQGERLYAKVAQHDRLIGEDQQHPLNAKRDVLSEEARRVNERRSNLNDALAWSAARWATDQAIAAGATVIYLEDLRTLEARGRGRTLNTRLSQTVRSQIADHIRHLAAEIGIAVVTVPARGTSKFCPYCLSPLRHVRSPDKPTRAGWKWAICPSQQCGWQGDRDQGAWQRIAARGLACQDATITDRTSGAMAICAVNGSTEVGAVITPKPAGRDRSKTGPTRKRTLSLAPRRRGAPSPARTPRRPGQRPEGHVPTGRRLPRAVLRNQDVTTTSTPIARPHRARGAALGAGFHLHAHATPPQWEAIPHQPPRLTQGPQAGPRRS